MSLISFTLRPGPSTIETDENANDTSTRTNSSNITEPMILKPLQSSDLSELVTNNLVAAFTSNLKSSLNMTQESLEKIQLQVTSNITSVLKSILLLTMSENEGIPSPPDEAAIHTPWYTSNPPNVSDYFISDNKTVIADANSTAKTIIDVALSKFNRDYWCVEKYNIIKIILQNYYTKVINEIIEILIMHMYNFL